MGKKGAVTTPAGVERVDLTGKTVMPAMVNAHIHIGYDKLTSWGAQNYGPQNIVDHLKREAYYGVGAVLSVGGDPTDQANRFQEEQQAQPEPAAARFFFAPVSLLTHIRKECGQMPTMEAGGKEFKIPESESGDRGCLRRLREPAWQAC